MRVFVFIMSILYQTASGASLYEFVLAHVPGLTGGKAIVAGEIDVASFGVFAYRVDVDYLGASAIVGYCLVDFGGGIHGVYPPCF